MRKPNKTKPNLETQRKRRQQRIFKKICREIKSNLPGREKYSSTFTPKKPLLPPLLCVFKVLSLFWSLLILIEIRRSHPHDRPRLLRRRFFRGPTSGAPGRELYFRRRAQIISAITPSARTVRGEACLLKLFALLPEIKTSRPGRTRRRTPKKPAAQEERTIVRVGNGGFQLESAKTKTETKP